MSVNGVTSTTNTTDLYGTYGSTAPKTAEKTDTANTTDNKSNTSGVVYETSKNNASTGTAKKVYKQDTALVNKLKRIRKPVFPK